MSAPDNIDLRTIVRDLFVKACRAADPSLALRDQLDQRPFPQPDPGGRHIVIAVGKAAIAMMSEALRHLPAPPETLAITVTNYENHTEIPGVTGFAAGHPVPDENGLAAGRAVISALSAATARDRVIALISGGGSALLPAPAEGLTLADKAKVNQLLLAAGADITEMNLIRQQLSSLKGGGMPRLAAPAPVTGYILSDVIGDDLRVIASGPTSTPIGSAPEAVELLQARGIWAALPQTVQNHLAHAKPAQTPTPASNFLIGSNGQSLAAVQEAARNIVKDWYIRIVTDQLTGDVAEAAATILAAIADAPKGQSLCLIFGGETTVTLRGDGLGGRNQELALRVAMAMPEMDNNWVFLSGGTDGRDGPTDAAGGLVDSGTLARMRATGKDPDALLANNDSNAALAAAGDLLITGSTGTNVADVQIFLRRCV